jgi:hypothetical protein
MTEASSRPRFLHRQRQLGDGRPFEELAQRQLHAGRGADAVHRADGQQRMPARFIARLAADIPTVAELDALIGQVQSSTVASTPPTRTASRR